jgi:hypothetical protein
MSAANRPGPPPCPACSDPEAAWEIASPVMAEDRIRFGASGVVDLGLFPPDEGLAAHGRPEITCVHCGTRADAELREVVLSAVVAAGQPHRARADA